MRVSKFPPKLWMLLDVIPSLKRSSGSPLWPEMSNFFKYFDKFKGRGSYACFGEFDLLKILGIGGDLTDHDKDFKTSTKVVDVVGCPYNSYEIKRTTTLA
ncbi:hypothetical protein Pyn_04192 [Prunus yedoensis var. nudiflora]|uniref:Uncharacterized protein n=1 Tax=Prunus yedoensis var. nudiflora TaxID=2094558 RepID=A0A314YM45_PRUYE|nr:hypothetical protein Pyn_04192 [Prunus yedoensis var. nudiflora]